MARLHRLQEHRGRDALLSTSMRDEIARLISKNQEYEARLNQLESRGQQEKQLPTTPYPITKRNRGIMNIGTLGR